MRARVKSTIYSHKSAPTVHVRWIDSCSSSGWGQLPSDEHLTPSKCETVGFLLKRTKREISVAQNKGETKFGEVMTIPTSCIRSIKKLR